MPREIAEQRISGSPYTERECYARLIDELGNARDTARGLGHLRKDTRWMMIAGTLQAIQDKVKILMVKPQGIVIPPGAFRKPQ